MLNAPLSLAMESEVRVQNTTRIKKMKISDRTRTNKILKVSDRFGPGDAWIPDITQSLKPIFLEVFEKATLLAMKKTKTKKSSGCGLI